ncbi:MAG: hypothetical protein E7378_04365 [Clostridiales bacterium]|nr:hypothetical protein [Clostridiales bacterium]
MYNNLLVNAENVYVYIYESNKLALCALNQQGDRLMMLHNKQIFKLRDICKYDLVAPDDCKSFKLLEFGKKVFPVFIKQEVTICGKQKSFLQPNVELFRDFANFCDLPYDEIADIFNAKFPMTKKTYFVQQLLDIQNKINTDVNTLSINNSSSMFLDF